MDVLPGWLTTPTETKNQSTPKVQLGQLLLQQGLINDLQLIKGLHYHKTHGIRLGEALLRLKFITEKALKATLATQLNIKVMPADYIELIPPNLSGYILKRDAWKHKVCPIRRMNHHLVIVMDDPTDTAVIAAVQTSSKLNVVVCTAPESVIEQVLHRLYGPPGALENKLPG